MAKFISLANLRRFMSYVDEALILVQNDYRSRIEGSVRFDTPQTLTDEEKTQAKENIGISGTGGGVEEAPVDGKQYARKDGAWSEVVSDLPLSVVDGKLCITYNN